MSVDTDSGSRNSHGWCSPAARHSHLYWLQHYISITYHVIVSHWHNCLSCVTIVRQQTLMSSFIDHTLLQFAFSSVENLSIQSKSQTILHIWPWPWKSVLKVTSQYGHVQYKSNMVTTQLYGLWNWTSIFSNWMSYRKIVDFPLSFLYKSFEFSTYNVI